MTGFFQELISAQSDPRVSAVLGRYGVTGDIRDVVGLARISVNGRFYEPCHDGLPALIVPVLEDDELVDLLAFDPRTPETWWLRQSASCLLGTTALADQLLGNPLHILRTPLAWLQANGEGCVVLDWKMAFPDLLGAPNGLACEDRAHARDLQSRLRSELVSRLPRIVVRARERVSV